MGLSVHIMPNVSRAGHETSPQIIKEHKVECLVHNLWMQKIQRKSFHTHTETDCLFLPFRELTPLPRDYLEYHRKDSMFILCLRLEDTDRYIFFLF